MSDPKTDTGMTDNSSFDRLRCPETGARLVRDGDVLRAESSARSYRLNDLGVPLFAESFLSSDAERQRDHYDRIAAAYVEHLDYPHTEVYTDYLDRALYEAIGSRDLGVTAELCCGRGEALRLLSDRIREGIGVDISEEMLNAATLRLRTTCGVMPGLRQKRIMIVVSMSLSCLSPPVRCGNQRILPRRWRPFSRMIIARR